MEFVWFILGAAIGGAVGAVVGWLIADRRASGGFAAMQAELAVAQERARDAEGELKSQQSTLDALRGDLSQLQQDRASLDARLSAEKENVIAARELAITTQASLDGVRGELSALLQERSTLLANLEAERKSLQEQREQLGDLSNRVRQSFAELSVEALKKNTDQFINLAEQKFKTLQTEAAGSLEQKRSELAQLLQPMTQVLDQYKEKLDAIERARADAYTNISKELASVAATQQNLSRETTQLVQALRKPQGRGRWGELTLKRLFEMAGMTQHVTFSEQVSVTTEDGRLRPDCVVHLPEERQVIVDSKCVVDAFLDASTCEDESLRRGHFARHAQQVRSRVAELSSKAYWERFEKATDYVVLFLPGEAFLYAAVEFDPMLIEDALNQRVIIASPTTLLGLLRVIEHAWRQKLIEANANEIRDLGATLYERISKMADHFQKLGDAINKAGDRYNDTLGSLERMVLPAARKMSEMGVGNQQATIGELDETKGHVRELSTKSWKSLPEPATS